MKTIHTGADASGMGIPGEEVLLSLIVGTSMLDFQLILASTEYT